METWNMSLGAVGLGLALLDFTGLTDKVEDFLDRARNGFEKLLKNEIAMRIIMFAGGIVLYLALWLVWFVSWLLNKPAKGMVGSLGLLLAIAGFVIGLI